VDDNAADKAAQTHGLPHEDEVLEPSIGVPRARFGCFTAATFGLNAFCVAMLAWISTFWERHLGVLLGIAFGCLEIGGIVLLYKWVIHYRRRALPEITVSVNPSPMRLGEPAVITWKMLGRTDRIDCLSIRIEGRLEVNYEDDGTFTHKHRIARALLLLTEEARLIREGRLEIRVPSNLWPTYKSKHGAIIWVLTLRGIAPHHIDLTEEYVLCVNQSHGSFVPPPALSALFAGNLENAKSVVVESKPGDWSPRVNGEDAGALA
jgi:hypothetical protein